jgi:hypothetical protein
MAASAGVAQNLMEPRMRATAAAVVGIMTNLVGAGLGPLVVGGLSDQIARRAITGGDIGTVSAGARAAETAPAGPSRAASAHGLQWACILGALIYFWGALHFALAARTLRRDLA